MRLGLICFTRSYLQKMCVGAGSQPIGQAPRLDGVSRYQSVLAKISLVGQRYAEPQARQNPSGAAAPVDRIGRAGCDGAIGF